MIMLSSGAFLGRERDGHTPGWKFILQFIIWPYFMLVELFT